MGWPTSIPDSHRLALRKTQGEEVTATMKDSIFDKKTLTRDVLNAISRFCEAKKFVGHDCEKYMIVSGSENGGPKNFVDVAVKNVATDKLVVRYALVLIGLV